MVNKQYNTITYTLPEDILIDVSGEHGRGCEHRGVCGGHDGRGDCPQTHKGDIVRREIAQHQR